MFSRRANRAGKATVPPPVARRILPAAALLALGIATSISAQHARAYVATRPVLELDGVNVPVTAVEGGGAFGDVVVEKVGPDNVAKKHLAGVKYDDVTMHVNPAALPKGLADWVTASWNRTYARKNGVVAETDFNGKEILRHTFTNAIIAETTIPTLDGASKNPLLITIALAPELVREAKPAGSAPLSMGVKARESTVADWKLDIAGLGGNISRIDSFTVKQKTVANAVGELRDYERQPGTIEYPNLTVTMSEAGDEKWDAWFQDFVFKGLNNDAQEKTGTLTLLSPDLKKAIATITLHNVGIYSWEPIAVESGAMRRMQAKLYVERMEIAFTP